MLSLLPAWGPVGEGRPCISTLLKVCIRCFGTVSVCRFGKRQFNEFCQSTWGLVLLPATERPARDHAVRGCLREELLILWVRISQGACQIVGQDHDMIF